MLSTPLLIPILIIFGCAFVVMGSCIALYQTKADIRIHPAKKRKLDGAALYIRVGLNGAFSTAIILAFVFLFEGALVNHASSSLVRASIEALAILILYDFLYYFMHRYPFHQWGWFKRVHAVHHRAKTPSAIDSLFLHPFENFAGLALLMLCTMIVGPVHPYAFIGALFTHAMLNIIVHMGIASDRFPFRYFSLLARKHDTHHSSMRAGNYASLTPIPDKIFGTAE